MFSIKIDEDLTSSTYDSNASSVDNSTVVRDSIETLYSFDDGLSHITNDYVSELSNYYFTFDGEVPYTQSFSPSNAIWGMGVSFRHIGNTFESICLYGNSTWEHNYYNGVEYESVNSGSLDGIINSQAGDLNNIDLYVIKNKAYFFVENSFISILNLSNTTPDLNNYANEDTVNISDGLYLDNQAKYMNGQETNFYNIFLSPTPLDSHKENTQMQEYDGPYINLYGTENNKAIYYNQVIEASFLNPDDTRGVTYGISFRESDNSREDVYLKPSNGKVFTIDTEDYSPYLKGSPGSENTILLIINQNYVDIFLNNNYIGWKDVNDNSGFTSIGIGYAAGNNFEYIMDVPYFSVYKIFN